MKKSLFIAFMLAGIVPCTSTAQMLTGKEAIFYQSLVDSTEHYRLKAPKKAMEFVTQILNEVPISQNEPLIIRTMILAANCQKMFSDKEKALQYTNGAIALAQQLQNSEFLLRGYFMKATIFDQMDEQDSSLVYYQRTIDLCGPDTEPHYISSSYTNVGQIYNAIGNEVKAEEYILKGYNLSTGDDFAHLFTLAAVISFYAQKDNPKYLPYLDTLAMSDFYKKASPTSFISHFDSFLMLEEASDAEREAKLREVYAYARENSSLVNQVGFGMKLYEHLKKQKRFEEGYALLLELQKTAIASRNGMREAFVTRTLYENAKARHAMRDALKHLERHSQLRDSLLSEENTGRIAELNIRFETAQKDHEIEQQKIRIEQEARNRKWMTALAILIAALGTLSFVYFRNRTRSAQRIAAQEKIIHQQASARLEQEKEMATLSASLETQERERNRIAQDLHDGIGSMMSGISSHVEFLRSATMMNAQNQKYLNQLRDMVKDTTTELRRTSYELMPAKLLRQGLEPAIRDLCLNQLVKNGIEPTMEIHSDLMDLNPDQQLTLYRIIQELLTNIVKHAHAHHVLIQITQVEHDLSLVVEDDGVGFQVESGNGFGGLGLSSLQNRVLMLNGFLDIASIPQEGTTITINFKTQQERQP